MRAVRVRTCPCELIASANLATLSPLGVSRMTRRSLSPEVRYTSLISTPTFFASSCAALARLGASLIERIPCSVQLSKHMNIGMRSSVRLSPRPLIASYQAPLVPARGARLCDPRLNRGSIGADVRVVDDFAPFRDLTLDAGAELLGSIGDGSKAQCL